MRLISLKLRNFRQHKETDILFQDGITGIIGRNGAGKSTLLEAIAWALYGQKAVQRMDRGKADTIRSRGSKRGEVPKRPSISNQAALPRGALSQRCCFSGDAARDRPRTSHRRSATLWILSSSPVSQGRKILRF